MAIAEIKLVEVNDRADPVLQKPKKPIVNVDTVLTFTGAGTCGDQCKPFFHEVDNGSDCSCDMAWAYVLALPDGIVDFASFYNDLSKNMRMTDDQIKSAWGQLVDTGLIRSLPDGQYYGGIDTLLELCVHYNPGFLMSTFKTICSTRWGVENVDVIRIFRRLFKNGDIEMVKGGGGGWKSTERLEQKLGALRGESSK